MTIADFWCTSHHDGKITLAGEGRGCTPSRPPLGCPSKLVSIRNNRNWNRNSLFQLFRFYTETESFDVSIEPKQTEDPPKQFEGEYIWVIFRKFRVVSICFGLLRNSSVCFGCFNIGSKHRNKPKFFVFGFTKQTETTRNRSCFGLFRFEPKFIFVCFEDTLPTPFLPITITYKVAVYATAERADTRHLFHFLYPLCGTLWSKLRTDS